MNSKFNVEKTKNSYFWLSLTLLSGFILGSCFQFRSTADKAPYKALEKYSTVLQFIEENYVDKIEANELVEGSINGMLDVLDPHSAYLPPAIYQQLKSETSGRFGGVGIEVSPREGTIVVIAPIEDTPAFRAGLKSGDRIIKIEDKETKNLSLTEAVAMMRGRVGTKVQLTIKREGQAKPWVVSLQREQIKMQSVRGTLLDGGLGYLRISSFIEKTAEDLKKTMDKLKSSAELRGWILDLRTNPGGLLDQAVKVSNLFIDEGPIVYTIGRNRDKREAEVARKGQKVSDLPLVVLVDGSSASASEIVAGAIQDHRRGVIAGQTSFGKGSVQTVIPIGDEAGLKLTVSRYYTPNGRSIQAKGIEPDVFLEAIDPKTLAEIRSRQKSVKEADLARHFENEGGEKALDPEELDAADGASLSLEERVKKDYMIIQAKGILRTMEVAARGPTRPEFRLDESASK